MSPHAKYDPCVSCAHFEVGVCGLVNLLVEEPEHHGCENHKALLCCACSGSGEGFHEGTKCRTCGGVGEA